MNFLKQLVLICTILISCESKFPRHVQNQTLLRSKLIGEQVKGTFLNLIQLLIKLFYQTDSSNFGSSLFQNNFLANFLSVNLTDKCRNHVKVYKKSLNVLELWALESKLPSSH